MAETPEAPTPAGDWFDGWLEHGTVAQRSVEIYGRPDLFARYEHLARDLQIAEDVEESGERAIGDDTITKLETEMAALYEEWQQSKTTWYIRALNPEEIEKIKDDCKFPAELGDKASEGQKREWEKAQDAANTRANLAMVSTALVKIENPDGATVRESMSVEQVAQLRAKLGDTTILRLVQAAMVAMSEDSTIPVPLSRTNSSSDRD